MVEAAGIEHFANSIKSTSYKPTVPKSCLKNSTGFGLPNHVHFVGYVSREGW